MRRSIAVLTAILSLGLLLSACDWSQYRYGPENTGYNPYESTLSTVNVSHIAEKFSASVGEFPSAAVIANGIAFVAAANSPSGGSLEAFDANGSSNCSGTPNACTPLWTSSHLNVSGNPVVANGLVYVNGSSSTYVFDAAGNTNCSGTPKVCQPLWSNVELGPSGLTESPSGSPTVANGTLYVSYGTEFGAFDAAGNTGCSGTPKTCLPLWTSGLVNTDFYAFAESMGRLYVSANTQSGTVLSAYDASGATNCTGTPKVCNPLSVYQIPTAATPMYGGIPTVSNGFVYLSAYELDSTSTASYGMGNLYVFDAIGITNCSGSPKLCAPLWTTRTLAFPSLALAVANGLVYLTSMASPYVSSNIGVYTYDASGVSNCSGAPKVCDPLWTASLPSSGVGQVFSAPSVANGVVYVAMTDPSQTTPGSLEAFDAAGAINCSGSPKTCTPIGSASAPGYPTEAWATFPTIANGKVYLPMAPSAIPSGPATLYAFGLQG